MFSEKQNLFEKTGAPFLFQSTTIENALFSCKTALSKTNVKTNRRGSAKWAYRKERNSTTTFFFLKIHFDYNKFL